MAQTNSKGAQRKMIRDKIQDRYDNLFSGKEELPSDMSIRQVQALRAHVAELEAHVAELQAKLSSHDSSISQSFDTPSTACSQPGSRQRSYRTSTGGQPR